MQYELLDRNGGLICWIGDAASPGQWRAPLGTRKRIPVVCERSLTGEPPTSVDISFEVYEASAARFVEAEHDDAAGIAAVRGGAAFLGM